MHLRALVFAALAAWSATLVPSGVEAKGSQSGILPAGLCGPGRYLHEEQCGHAPPPKYALLLASTTSTDAAEVALAQGRAATLAAGYPFAISSDDLAVKGATPGTIEVVAALFADRKRAEAYRRTLRLDVELVELVERPWPPTTLVDPTRHTIAVELTRDTPAWSPKELRKLEDRLGQMKWIPYARQLVRRDAALAKITPLCELEAGRVFATTEDVLYLRFQRVYAPARCADGREAWVPWRATRLDSVVRTTAKGPRLFQVVLVECDQPTIEERRWEPRSKRLRLDLPGPC